MGQRKEKKTMAKTLKTSLVPLLVSGLWFVQGVAAPAAHAKKVALLIGIGDYIHLRDTSDTHSKLPPGDLRGPRNDAKAIKVLLVQRFGFQEVDIQVLLDQEATEENVRKALRGLVDRAQRGDEVFLFFSGHGSRRLESNYQKREERDEEDGWDETLVCADDDRGAHPGAGGDQGRHSGRTSPPVQCGGVGGGLALHVAEGLPDQAGRPIGQRRAGTAAGGRACFGSSHPGDTAAFGMG
jgi:hypothetical protein